METVESSEERKRIDEALFWPMANYFADDAPNFLHFRDIIETKNPPRGRLSSYSNYGGFVFEAFVNWTIGRFCDACGIDIRRLSQARGEIESYGYKMNKWGNVIIFKKGKGFNIEIDGLYEFRRNGSLTPIIIEASISSKSKNYGKKRKTVNRFYDSPSYFCMVRRRKEGDSNPDVYQHPLLNYHREITIPKRQELEALTEEMWKDKLSVTSYPI